MLGRWVVDDPKGLYEGNVTFPVENNEKDEKSVAYLNIPLEGRETLLMNAAETTNRSSSARMLLNTRSSCQLITSINLPLVKFGLQI